jgi:catechol 2,3-dioxygenase-like lactoylglutathione lyase family enzyme
MTAAKEIRGLSHVMLGAADVERSVEFYRDVLGLELKGRFEHFAFLDAGATTLALSGELWRQAAREREPFELVFSVDSVGAAYTTLKPRITFVNEPRQVNQENWAVNFTDPDGHLLSLYGPR